jgi:hypothetical protein
MPQNPDREPTRMETIRSEAFNHAEAVSTVGLTASLVAAFTVLGAPVAVAMAFVLGVAMVYLIQLARR